MKTSYDIIVRPIITEDSMEMAQNKKYVFQVMTSANKTEIKRAVEEVFGVKVAAVNTMNYDGKKKRLGARPQGKTAAWKKAIVTLTSESKTIEFFDGMF